MKFPITRESLQAFDPFQEKKERDEIIIKNHINHLVQNICHTIENIMVYAMPMPPGTKRVYQVLTQSSLRNEKHYETMMAEKRFVWNELRTIRKPKCGGNDIDVSESILIPLLVEKLKENFIGCNIIVDPLNTYIIIDWS